MTIAHNRFWSGHGLSIGSNTNGGVSAVRVSDLTIDGADNGLRIKSDRSRGGLVEDVAYEDVCMRNVAEPDRPHLDVHHLPRHAPPGVPGHPR